MPAIILERITTIKLNDFECRALKKAFGNMSHAGWKKLDLDPNEIRVMEDIYDAIPPEAP